MKKIEKNTTMTSNVVIEAANIAGNFTKPTSSSPLKQNIRLNLNKVKAPSVIAKEKEEAKKKKEELKKMKESKEKEKKMLEASKSKDDDEMDADN